MEAEISLEIVSPEASLVSKMVESVILPGTKGSFEVLKDHAPLISSLEKGEVRFVSDGKEETLAIKSGFVEVCANKVSVCAEV